MLTMHRHTSRSFVLSCCHPNKLEICMWVEKTFQDQRNSQLTIYYWDRFPCQSIKTKCDPNGDIFYYGEAIFLPFYDTIFTTSIIHYSLIREHNIVTLVFTLRFGSAQALRMPWEGVLVQEGWIMLLFLFGFSVQRPVGHDILLWACSNPVTLHIHLKRNGEAEETVHLFFSLKELIWNFATEAYFRFYF